MSFVPSLTGMSVEAGRPHTTSSRGPRTAVPILRHREARSDAAILTICEATPPAQQSLHCVIARSDLSAKALAEAEATKQSQATWQRRPFETEKREIASSDASR